MNSTKTLETFATFVDDAANTTYHKQALIRTRQWLFGYLEALLDFNVPQKEINQVTELSDFFQFISANYDDYFPSTETDR